MFSSVPQSILYVTSKGFFLIAAQGVISQFAFLPELVQYTEIQNKENFTLAVKKYFSENKVLKQSVVIILAPDLLLQKVTDQDQPIPADFSTFVPLSELTVAQKSFHYGTQHYYIATNKLLFEVILKEAQKELWSVQNILPASIAEKVIQNSVLVPEELRILLENHALIRSCDFLNESGHIQTADEKEHTQEKKKIVVQSVALILGFLFLAGAVAFVLHQNAVNSVPRKNSSAASPKPSATAIPSPMLIATPSAPSATPSATLTISDFRTNILNGSGISGQAGKVKDVLTQLGIQNITLGNAPKQSGSTIAFSSKVSEDDKKKITTALKPLLQTVTILPVPSEAADVILTTGK